MTICFHSISAGRSLLVLFDAGIVDNAAPIEAEGEVVGVAVGILIAAQVARHVFKLLLDGLHVGRHLHGKQGGGFRLAADDVEQGLMLHVEGNEDGVGMGLNLRKHHRTASLKDDDDRFVAHRLLSISDEQHIIAVIGLDGLATETAVGGLLHRIAASDTHGTGKGGGIIAVLQAEGQIAVAALLHVVVAEAEARAGFFYQTDGEVGLSRRVHHVKILLHKIEADGHNL